MRVTQEGLWRANVSVGWTDGDAKPAPEPLAVMSDQNACRARLSNLKLAPVVRVPV